MSGRFLTVAVPCFNEAERFDASEFARMLEDDRVGAVFVNDGSADRTADVLREFCQGQPDAELLDLPENRGKAEAVRAGMQHGLTTGARAVGYLDADLATPVDELFRLVDELEHSGADVVIGARIALAGSDIERSRARHYLGRVFATVASLALSERIYDTQCGAKLFARGDTLDMALSQPFRSRWAFDVELLGRLLGEGATIHEVPLKMWRDVQGSKLSWKSMATAGLDLAKIAVDLRRKRSR